MSLVSRAIPVLFVAAVGLIIVGVSLAEYTYRIWPVAFGVTATMVVVLVGFAFLLVRVHLELGA
jgi:hypothetical protein